MALTRRETAGFLLAAANTYVVSIPLD